MSNSVCNAKNFSLWDSCICGKVINTIRTFILQVQMVIKQSRCLILFSLVSLMLLIYQKDSVISFHLHKRKKTFSKTSDLPYYAMFLIDFPLTLPLTHFHQQILKCLEFIISDFIISLNNSMRGFRAGWRKGISIRSP